MTIKEALLFGEVQLNNLETPNLDASVLLAFVTKKPKIFLYAHGEKSLTTKQWRQYQSLIRRRIKHEPIAYLVSEKEFYGRTFFVDKRVLIPRPETELIIDIAKTIATDTIVDVGTGSGAIAITLAKELKKTVTAIDISPGALAVAKQNAKRHHARIQFWRGNLLEPILKKFKIQNSKFKISEHRSQATHYTLLTTNYLIVANLPYLPTERAKILSADVKKYEPRIALMGGIDGLKYYRQLLNQMRKLSNTQWTLLAEIDSLQEKTFTQMAKKILPKADLVFKKDLAGHIRVVIIKA